MKIALFTLFIGFCLCACTPVQPWERGTLAKAQMALDPHPATRLFHAHNYNSREASTGGGMAKGGGCGCN